MARKKKTNTDINTERQHVERSMYCDTTRLYGTLDTAIAYLKEVKAAQPNARLDEHWTGYEDMHMRFEWWEPETDEEYQNRLELERETIRRKAEDEQRQAERTKDLAELRRLKQKLGLT